MTTWDLTKMCTCGLSDQPCRRHIDNPQISVREHNEKIRRGKTMTDLQVLLDEWDDPLGANTFSDAEELIHELRLEIAGKDEVIKQLHDDIRYYRKDWKDQMIQDQGSEDK